MSNKNFAYIVFTYFVKFTGLTLTLANAIMGLILCSHVFEDKFKFSGIVFLLFLVLLQYLFFLMICPDQSKWLPYIIRVSTKFKNVLKLAKLFEFGYIRFALVVTHFFFSVIVTLPSSLPADIKSRVFVQQLFVFPFVLIDFTGIPYLLMKIFGEYGSYLVMLIVCSILLYGFISGIYYLPVFLFRLVVSNFKSKEKEEEYDIKY